MDIRRFATLALGLVACTTHQALEPARYAAVDEQLRLARAEGAARTPLGALHIGLAEDELRSARGLAADGEYRTATHVLARAQADAELARELGREASVVAKPAPEPEPVAPPERSPRAAKEKLAPLADVAETESATVITLSDSLLFRKDSAELLDTAGPTLDDVARAAAESASPEVTVRAFDATSKLARARAASVERALAARGTKPRLVEGFGGDVDRRVEVTVRGAP